MKMYIGGLYLEKEVMQEFQLDYRTWIYREDQLNQYGCEKDI